MKPSSSFIFLASASIALIFAIVASSPVRLCLRLFNWKTTADLVVRNAIVYTSNDSLPFVDSIAVHHGRILRLGNYSSLKELVGYGTKELDLKGKIVVPGFIDSHLHFIWGGRQLTEVDLRGINKKDDFVRRVKEAARNAKPGSWIFGGGWNNDLWGGDLPTASWIDHITLDNPVWLSRMDRHMGLANTAALKVARIINASEDPHGGIIMRTASGVPTGLLIDSAMNLLFTSIPEVSVDERREAFQRASKHALMRGVTTVVDLGRYLPGSSVEPPWKDFSDVYQWADSSGKMRIRVCLFFPLETWSRLLDVVNKMGRAVSQWIYLGGVKAFADGSLGSNSALFYEPYVDEPQNYGLQLTDYEKLFNMTLASDSSGLQVAIHAIGDRANDLILDMYEKVISENGLRDRRFRIEHCQHLAPETPDRFGKLGIVASVQPEHLLDDLESATKKLGFNRAQKGSYLFRSLLSSNVELAFGSDWPVADVNPLGGIRTAMKRISPAWDNAWAPSESISVNEALKAYTISAARACFLDKDIGSLSPGKLADFVVLSTDSWDNFAAEGSASIEATYVSGVQVYP
ncbi:uncharacterized protein LOC21407815 [Morus notabilis]|uniref:uncharacterized protein LOC21407815 n=1 Tax=Morus notabilis TaxID=981085 RepID=UPI000CED246B|nr:uncharacterized protein LOC21407815 [Morus notabilis]